MEDQKKRVTDQFYMLGNLVSEHAVKATTPVYAEKTFNNQLDFTLGNTRFEIHHAGPAHTAGDSFVWLPRQGVMFTGDIVFTERMLGIQDYSNSKGWIKAFDAMAAYKPKYIVPGHGHVTDLAQAKKDTYDYLVDLRKNVADFMGQGRDISEIGTLDQSRYDYLHNHETLSGRNAQKVFTELEWE